MSPASKKEKEASLIQINGLLAILMIVVLLLPIASAYYSDFHKSAVVLTASDSDLKAPNYIFTQTFNDSQKSDIITGFAPDPTEIYDEADNQSYIYKSTQDEIAFFDSVVTSGNSSIVSGLNYSVMTAGAGEIQVGFLLDITSHELTEADFIEVTLESFDETAFDMDSFTLTMRPDTIGVGLTLTETANGTYIAVFDLSAKTSLLSYPDTYCYLQFNTADETEEAWTFTIATYELSSTVWSWDDFQLYGMAIMGSVVIMIVAIAFNTDALDIKIDRNRKDGR